MPEYRPNERQAITNLQRYLRQISLTVPGMTVPPIDGIFESNTRKSLTDFQRMNGLEPTGTADRKTWDRLFSEYNKSFERENKPIQVSVFPRNPLSTTLNEFNEYYYTTVLQFMLREISNGQDNNAEELQITGKFDEPTKKTVIIFQEQNGLDPTGEVDIITWNRLSNVFNRRYNEYDQ